MATVLHTVVETPTFLRAADLAGVTENERRALVDTIAANPSQGDEVVGSGGVRKVRVAGKGRGKRGGYRVMVAYIGETAPAYLLGVLSKGDRETFDQSEIAVMKGFTAALKLAWRKRNKT